jgi:hypothetical protein
MAGQVFCTLEAPGTMATSMGKSVHVVAFMCFIRWLEKWLEVFLELEAGGRLRAFLLA